MRAAAVCALPALLVACPLAWGVWESVSAPQTGDSRLPLAQLSAGWVGTLAWTVPVAIIAAALGWMPGRLLHGRLQRGQGLLLACAVTAVALVPPYAIFYCAWRACRPGTWLADWAASGGHVGVLRGAFLGWALVAWLWPVAAWSVAILAPRRRADSDAAACLDPQLTHDRIARAWRRDWPALVTAIAVMVLALVGETTSFDVAQVVTASSELRLLDAAGVGGAELWRVAAAPAAVTMVVAWLMMMWWRTRPSQRDAGTDDGSGDVAHGAHVARGAHAAHAARGACALVIALVALSVVVPIAALVRDGVASGAWRPFMAIHGQAAAGSLASAAMGGALGAVVAGGTCVGALGSRSARWLVAAGLMWACGAALPGVLVAGAYESMWNASATLRHVYDSPAIVPMAQVAHAGVVCWMLGIWMAGRIPREAIDVERIHGRGALDSVRAHGPCILASSVAGAAIMTAYCASETAIASRLLAPGAARIAPMLLSAIHYQDQSAVLASLPWMALVAVVMAAAAVGAWSWAGRAGRAAVVRHVALLIAGAIGALQLPGCGEGAASPQPPRATAVNPDDPSGAIEIDPLDRGGAGFGAMTSDISVSHDAPPALDCIAVIGMRGRMPGRLDYPRAADVAPDGSVVIIDKSGRVQRFAPGGTMISGWRMPRTDNGMPTGVSVDRHGRLWIADTHEHRVLIVAPEGRELGSFGAYGRGDGEFVYPTDILFLDDADPTRCRVVVSEYGGNDRLQWFDVAIDGDHGVHARRVASLGRQGSGAGEFLRPQSMSRAPDGTIAVADACNHRIVRVSADGDWLGAVGEPGRGLGQLAYPYGVSVTGTGDLLVAEFGNNRIQCLDAGGRGLWVRGGGGRDEGRLVAPWSVVATGEGMIVVDAGNCRVLHVRMPTGLER
jgi:hypothetical protein